MCDIESRMGRYVLNILSKNILFITVYQNKVVQIYASNSREP